MKQCLPILILLSFTCISAGLQSQDLNPQVKRDKANPFVFTIENAQLDYSSLSLQDGSVGLFINQLETNRYLSVIASLNDYKKKYAPDDWLYYQLIRRTAQQMVPKEKNYYKYTLCKWFLLVRSGYNAMITVSANKMLLYIQCDENIYNIPNRISGGKQFVCLNYHDYGTINFDKEIFSEVELPASNSGKTFSYKVTHIPDVPATEYLEKDLHFTYYENDYHFKIKLSEQVKNLFTNYPVVDYEAYLNIPLSSETYNSLIPLLKKNLKGMKVKNGVDYLMRFTRYAFLYEKDSVKFGGEKRLSPEQTLLYEQSDCEDRVALFFYLVKEIYDLPMIVLSYPNHVTIAIEFDKPVGKSITYNGKKYTICEPTPQKQDLNVGDLLPELSKVPYQVSYAYHPAK